MTIGSMLVGILIRHLLHFLLVNVYLNIPIRWILWVAPSFKKNIQTSTGKRTVFHTALRDKGDIFDWKPTTGVKT